MFKKTVSIVRRKKEYLCGAYSKISKNNKKLGNFTIGKQKIDNNGLIIKNENIRKLRTTIWEYFYIPELIGKDIKLQLEKSHLDLDIVKFLRFYKKYIEKQLIWLDELIIEKIKQSIWLRFLKLSKIIKDRISFVDMEIDEGDYIVKDSDWYRTIWEVRMTEIWNQKWIINSKIKEQFWFVDNKLLVSAEILLKYWKKYWNKELSEEVKKIYKISYKLEEVEEMFEAKIDKNWNFNEWFFSTQNIFDLDNEKDLKFIKENDIFIWKKISLLTKEDLEVEKNAITFFMAAVSIQVWGESIWWPLGIIAWWAIDFMDTFSDTEKLLDAVQMLWFVDPNYRMEKTLKDNFLAGIWIIPYTTQLVKGTKLTKWYTKLSKMDQKKFWKAFELLKNNKQSIFNVLKQLRNSRGSKTEAKKGFVDGVKKELTKKI